jgi:hypothetical protein
MPSDGPPLPCRTLVEVAEMLRAREITSVQLTEAVLAHIAAHEPQLHAFCCLMPEQALATAAACDAEIAAAGGTKGPMHGVPIAVKDLYAVAGVQNAAGSKALLVDPRPTHQLHPNTARQTMSTPGGGAAAGGGRWKMSVSVGAGRRGSVVAGLETVPPATVIFHSITVSTRSAVHANEDGGSGAAADDDGAAPAEKTTVLLRGGAGIARASL